MTFFCLQAMRENDEPLAFNALFKRYYVMLSRHIFKLTQNSEAAEELTDDIMVDLWNKRQKLDIQLSLKSYLYKAATFKAYDHLRKKSRTPQQSDLDNIPDLGQKGTQNADDNLKTEEVSRQINAALDKLPPKCRMVFELSRFKDYTYKQIAKEMEISVKTVENQISKALKILRGEIYGN